VGIAVDESVDDVRPWVDGISFPVLLDRDRAFCDQFGVINVPTVIWLDEQRSVVRPNAPAFADDTFVEFHGVPSAPHHEALRRWVLDEIAPMDEERVIATRHRPSADEQLARAHFRLATWLLRAGLTDQAANELATAGSLAPNDFTIRRAGLALVGDDPFGQKFFDLYEDWKQRTGGAYYDGD